MFAGREELLSHAIKALRESLQQDKELSVENTSLAVGGVKGEAFKMLEGEQLRAALEAAAVEGGAGGGEAAQEGGSGDRMDTS